MSRFASAILVCAFARACGPERVESESQADSEVEERLPPGAAARLGTLRWRAPEGISQIDFSKNGALAASVGWNGSVRLWEASTGRELARLTGHRRFVAAVVFCDGLLASAGEDGTVRVWDTDPPSPRAVDSGHGSEVLSLAWSSGLSRLASGDAAGRIRIRPLAAGGEILGFPAHAGAVNSLAFAPDGAWLASGGADGKITIWDPKNGRSLRSFKAHAGGVSQLSVDVLRGTLVSAADDDPKARTWDASTGKLIREVEPHGKGVTSLALSPIDGRLAAGNAAGQIALSPAETGTKEWTLPHSGILCLRFTPDGKRLAAGTPYGIFFRDADFEAHRASITAAAASPSGVVVTGGSDGAIMRWPDVESGRARPVAEASGLVRDLSLDRKGDLMAWADASGVGLVKLREGIVEKIPEAGVWQAELSPDGAHLAVAFDGKVRLWDVGRLKSLWTRETFLGSVVSLKFSSDGSSLWTAGDTGAVQCSLSDGSELSRLREEEHKIVAADFSLRAPLMVSAHADGSVRIWTLRGGTPLGTISAGPVAARSVAFSADGSLFALAAGTERIRAWETDSMEPLGERAGHLGRILHLAGGGVGSRILSCAEDTTALLWDRWTAPSPSQDVALAVAALADAPAPEAWSAMESLLAAGDRAVDALAACLQAEEPRIRRLMERLDVEDVAVREDAIRALRALGPQIEAIVREALDARPTAESAARLRRLVEEVGVPPHPSGPARLWSRAVRVLDRLGSPESRALLRRLNTAAARAALQRLER